MLLDDHQNARDRTVASAYSVRPTLDARVSAPVRWGELSSCDPADLTLATVAARCQREGDPHADIDAHPCSLEPLLALALAAEQAAASSVRGWGLCSARDWGSAAPDRRFLE